MLRSVSTGGHIRVIATEVGPERDVELLPFRGRADTGFIPQSHIQTNKPPVAYINVNTGALVAAGTFGGVTQGGISQIDTGVGDLSGSIFMAIVTDTGTATLG